LAEIVHSGAPGFAEGHAAATATFGRWGARLETASPNSKRLDESCIPKGPRAYCPWPSEKPRSPSKL
jgi:hypothetical protein